MFFQNSFNPSMIGPQSLTSPPLDPQALAALMAMGGAGGAPSGMPGANPGGMAPQLPQGQPVNPGMGAPRGPAGPGPQPQQTDLLQMLSTMDPNKLKQMLAQFGLGGGGGGAMSMGGLSGMNFGTGDNPFFVPNL